MVGFKLTRPTLLTVVEISRFHRGSVRLTGRYLPFVALRVPEAFRAALQASRSRLIFLCYTVCGQHVGPQTPLYLTYSTLHLLT